MRKRISTWGSCWPIKDEALREFQTAAKLAPGDVNAHWRLGRLYRTMGKTAEAKVEFDKAKTLNRNEDERLLKVMSKTPAGGQKSGSLPEAK